LVNYLGGGFFLDKAKAENGGSFSSSAVEGSKAVIRLIPFLFAMIPYWGVYGQMSTVFQNQVIYHIFNSC